MDGVVEWLALCLGYSGGTGFLISVVIGCFDIVYSFTQSLHKNKDSVRKEVTPPFIPIYFGGS
jgi:hypothetical protein